MHTLQKYMSSLVVLALLLGIAPVSVLATESTIRGDIVTSENLQLTDLSYSFNRESSLLALNEGSIAALELFFTVEGPENVAEVRIGRWTDKLESNSTYAKELDHISGIWKENGNFAIQQVPFRVNGTGRPVFSDEQGKSQFVMLVGLN